MSAQPGAAPSRSEVPLGGILPTYGLQLGEIAAAAIRHGLEAGAAPEVVVSAYPGVLRDHRASFVTLKKDGDLRGCVGSLLAYRPLVLDVSDNTFGAGFRDPRFAPLRPDEADRLSIGLTLLDPLEPLAAHSESELLGAVVPRLHGLVLEADDHRAVFLPAVWEQLPDPADFMARLKQKAGLAADAWSTSFRFWRFTTESAELA